jgi:hypothetical protein
MTRTRLAAFVAALTVVVLNIIRCAIAAPPAYTDAPINNPDAWVQNGKHVEFAISVIEDYTGSFNEFPVLKAGMLLVSDSSTTLGAVRIMDKNNLVKSISAPKITCDVGATANVNTKPNNANGTNSNSAAVAIEAIARSVQQVSGRASISVEIKAEAKQDGDVSEAMVRFLIREGQTAVVKLGRTREIPDRKHAPVYVVITPKLAK